MANFIALMVVNLTGNSPSLYLAPSQQLGALLSPKTHRFLPFLSSG
jgi:hypothetical protein